MLVERTFTVGPVTISYVDEPNDGPPLLFLHGLSSRWQNFVNVLPAFTARWHVYAADLRGHGQTSHVTGQRGEQYGVMAYASDIIALLRHLGGGPTVLIGQSLGSMISIGVASEAPELVKAVVLGDPPLGAFDGRPFATRPEYARFVAQRELRRAGLPLPELTAKLAALSPGQDAVTSRFRAVSLHQADPEILTPVVENGANDNYDLGARLRQIACPVLMLQGNPELGGALEDREARWAASLIPDCTHVTMPHVGHGVHSMDGAGYIQYVTSFLESL